MTPFDTAATSNPSQAYTWQAIYAKRRPISYGLEERRLFKSGQKDRIDLVGTFFDIERSALDPPNRFSFSTLRSFLERSTLGLLEDNNLSYTPSRVYNDVVLLDDRQDKTGSQTASRQWDDEGNPGYLFYPPTGTIKTSKAMNIKDFMKILEDKVCLISISFHM
jgi:hypothetical protein